MRRKWWIFVLILSLAINAAVFATAGFNYYRSSSPAPYALSHKSPTDHQHLYQTLGLSTSQLEGMDSLAEAFHARLERIVDKMREKRGLLVDLLRQENIDAEKVEALRKGLADIQDEIQREVITHIEEIKKILNREQQERFFNLLRISMESEGNHWLPEKGE